MTEWINEWLSYPTKMSMGFAHFGTWDIFAGMNDWMFFFLRLRHEWIKWMTEWINEWLSYPTKNVYGFRPFWDLRHFLQEWMTECFLGLRHEWINEWLNEWLNDCLILQNYCLWFSPIWDQTFFCRNEWLNESLNDWMNDWMTVLSYKIIVCGFRPSGTRHFFAGMNDWMDKWMTDRFFAHLGEWINESMNKSMNEWIDLVTVFCHSNNLSPPLPANVSVSNLVLFLRAVKNTASAIF